MEKMYQALKVSLSGIPQMLPYPTDISKHIKNPNTDHYISLYQYNQTHKDLIEKNKSFAGIEDTTTDRLFFDLDSKDDLELARVQTAKLIGRLINDGIEPDSIQAFFTGKKGFSLEVQITERITPAQFKNITKTLAKDFSCLDTKITDPVRIVRVANTKHQSGLFKIPLDIDETQTLSVDEIKTLAQAPRQLGIEYSKSKLPESYKIIISPSKPRQSDIIGIDWTNKPKDWRNCKWSLLQGGFKGGERHHAMTVIAATCRGLGYDRETAYYMCKSAIKKQAKLHNQEEFSTDEVWENILESIYSPDWKGGQYSCQNDIWLGEVCENLGDHKCKNDKSLNSTIQITEAARIFKDYAQNIDKLTIKSGIPALDNKMRMTIGMSIGIVAGPGVGKTSIAIQMLNEMSKRDELCIFYSLDMYHAIVYQKLAQKHTGKEEDYIFKKFQEGDPEFEKMVDEKLAKEYKNVEFCFDAGQTIEQLEQSIPLIEEKRGKKVRFIVIDYNELIITDKSDGTASSAYVAQNLRKIAKVHNCCVLTLLQPNKASGSPADEITSYRSAKGSSAIEQSLSIMLAMSRPGYDPRHPEDDKFITVGCLKNRMGKLFTLDCAWDGLTGHIRQMTQEENSHLKRVLDRKRAEKEEKNGGGNGDWL